MAKREQILRYMLVIRKLRRSKTATFKEIRDYLELESEIQGYNMNIAIRTFQRDIQDIASLFNVEIEYNFSGKYYHIVYDEDDDANNRMLEAFDLFNTLNLSHSLSNFIFFDKQQPQGIKHIMGMLHAIRNLKTVRFTYKKYNHPETTTREAEPYAIKEHRRKWYLYARDQKDGIYKTFGLDRLQDLEITKKPFVYPVNFDVKTIFNHTYGIYQPWEIDKPSDIVLDFEPRKGEEIIANPMHHTQKHQVMQNGNIRVILKVFETYDLVADILQCGDLVNVVKPVSLRNKLIAIYQNALEQYRGS
jgi:predicted DNA-binding transcriptional regulator YafY